MQKTLQKTSHFEGISWGNRFELGDDDFLTLKTKTCAPLLLPFQSFLCATMKRGLLPAKFFLFSFFKTWHPSTSSLQNDVVCLTYPPVGLFLKEQCLCSFVPYLPLYPSIIVVLFWLSLDEFEHSLVVFFCNNDLLEQGPRMPCMTQDDTFSFVVTVLVACVWRYLLAKIAELLDLLCSNQTIHPNKEPIVLNSFGFPLKRPEISLRRFSGDCLHCSSPQAIGCFITKKQASPNTETTGRNPTNIQMDKPLKTKRELVLPPCWMNWSWFQACPTIACCCWVSTWFSACVNWNTSENFTWLRTSLHSLFGISNT